ncbi:MAG: ADP compounds hydrolase NudE [Gammaproteobacteria bacterium]|nr:MAG: ADP compounds hydrolase NudE [Gammaproteobacteria bacterium]
MTRKPVITRTETLARTRLFRVESVGLRFSNGTEVEFERLRSPSRGAVLVVLMLDADTVLLIREYAAGVERYELALPKGRIEDGEAVVEAANREIMEEVGYGARRLTPLKIMTLAPGAFDHATHVVLAEELYPARLEGDEPEALEVVPWRLDALAELLEHEECTEARSIAALFMARDLLCARP